jgi:hypothetical protein
MVCVIQDLEKQNMLLCDRFLSLFEVLRGRLEKVEAGVAAIEQHCHIINSRYPPPPNGPGTQKRYNLSRFLFLPGSGRRSRTCRTSWAGRRRCRSSRPS